VGSDFVTSLYRNEASNQYKCSKKAKTLISILHTPSSDHKPLFTTGELFCKKMPSTNKLAAINLQSPKGFEVLLNYFAVCAPPCLASCFPISRLGNELGILLDIIVCAAPPWLKYLLQFSILAIFNTRLPTLDARQSNQFPFFLILCHTCHHKQVCGFLNILLMAFYQDIQFRVR